MKKVLIAAGLLTLSFGFAQKTDAQVRLGIHINIGDQPPWRAPGYNYVEYYYLPDIECYYYVPRHQFVYLSNGRWVFSASLPYRYRNYNLYSGRKVVVNRPDAYNYFDEHRRSYGKRNNWNNFEHRDNGNHRGNNGHHHGHR